MKNNQNNTPRVISGEEYEERIKQLKDLNDVTNFAKELIAPTLQKMLEAELDNHLGYKKHEYNGRNFGNSRNGSSVKKLKTSFGQTDLEIPRDRNGTFEPLAVKKHETIQSDIEERIVSMYAKGMTTRDISNYMQDIYGVEVSAGMISAITEKVIPLITEWQSRPLDSTYPFISLDGIYYKVRDGGRIVNRTAYVVLGTNMAGYKDILGIWVGESEGSKFWLGILNELKNRGVNDILIASVDGLPGFSDAIKTIFPDTVIQRCIVHQIRNSMKYVPHKHKKSFASDLKTIYTAPTEEAGLEALTAVQQKWKEYSLYLKSWEDNWIELSPLFQYPEEIRKIMYTTNQIESVNRQFRKVTKTTSVFPHDEALIKLLWLAQRDITKKWTSAVHNWGVIISQLAILFPEKIRV
jgi:putative transposase